MQGALTYIPYYIYKANNWYQKKQQILNCIDFSLLKRQEMNAFETDLHDTNNSYRDSFLEIFSQEMQEFGKEIGVDSFTVEKIWTVEYKKNDFHDAHTHSRSNFTGILYLDFIPQEHSPTFFIFNQIDPITKKTLINYPRDIDEGDILIVPSDLLHYTRPNTSNLSKRVVSFDIIF